MSSVIAPMPRARCVKCNQNKFNETIADSNLKISVYRCESCDGPPDQLRLRRSLPIGTNGKSIRVEILFNRVGDRITSIDEALHIARAIDYDLRDGRFDPNEYRTKNMTASFLFKNLVEGKYISYCDNKFGVKGYETKQVMINHLVNFFGKKDIRKIKASDIKDFQLTYKCGSRSKDLAIQEMGVLLSFFKELDYIKFVPTLPETNQSRKRSISEVLTESEQCIVISMIEDEYYRDMIEVLSIFAFRPGDLRAIKWKDLDFKNKCFKIDEHFAKSVLKPGRKSTNEELDVPFTDRFLEIVEKLPRSINGEDYLFRAKDTHGRITNGPVGEARMRIHWNKAMLKAHKKHKIKKVSLYVGTKSSTVTKYRNSGSTTEELVSLTGISAKMIDRYGFESKENRLNKARNVLNNTSKSGTGF